MDTATYRAIYGTLKAINTNLRALVTEVRKQNEIMTTFGRAIMDKDAKKTAKDTAEKILEEREEMRRKAQKPMPAEDTTPAKPAKES